MKPSHQPRQMKYTARTKKLTCCTPPTLTATLPPPLMVTLVCWFTGRSVSTLGSRLSTTRPSGRPMTVKQQR